MGFSIAQYAALRPTLWHLTHSQNLELIRKAGVLMPTILLTSASGHTPRRGRKIIPGVPVVRDQDLLHEKCIEFESGYNPSHKCFESPKPNSDRLAFVVQLPDCS